MGGLVDIKGPIIADTVYTDGVLAARDTAVTFPGVNFATADFKALGTLSLPIIGQIDSMELSVSKSGVDVALGRLAAPFMKNIEVRWVQDTIQADGNTKTEGCKAFFRAIPKSLPGVSVDPGNNSDNSIPFEVVRYQLITGGDEVWLIDRLANIVRILGVDYYKKYGSLL